jgi:CBS domain containing-hemolysin-like protein
MFEWDHLHFGILALFMSSFFSTLSCSFRSTGDAGVPRLIDKNPGMEKLLSKWKNRWNILLLSIRACLGLSEIAAIYCAAEASQKMPTTGIFVLMLCAIPLYMIFIRMIPFVLSESYADRISINFLPLSTFISSLLYVFIWPINWIENKLLLRALSSSAEHDHPTAEDEILSLMEQACLDDLCEDEREMIRSVLELSDTVAREIMTPRVDVEGLKHDLTVQDCLSIVRESRYTRFPVYHEKLDDIRGIIHVKDLLRCIAENNGEQPILPLLKAINFVPETMPISDLLKQMQHKRAQMVLVVDEYGGTSGIVCMEDIIEELVGKIEDEYDHADTNLQQRPDGSYLIDARMPVADLNEELDLHLPESDEYDSLGGYMLMTLGHIPAPKESIETEEVHLSILSANPRQIISIRLELKKPADS